MKLQFIDEDILLTEEKEDENKSEEKPEEKPNDLPPPINKNIESEEDKQEDDLFGSDENDELTLSDIGKVYVLKNIYTTLSSLYNYVDSIITTGNLDPRLIKLQEVIQEIKDMYLLVAFNIEKYLDKIDTIITYLKKVIKIIAKELDNVMETIDKSDKKQDIKPNTSNNNK